MPPKVAAAGRESLSGKFISRINETYNVGLNEAGNMAHIEKFWSVDEKVLNLAESLASNVPEKGEEIINRAHEAGCEDMFPHLTNDEEKFIVSDGKIPIHSRWEKKITEGKIAPDTLLTLAGLASFSTDQHMLDKRIKDIIG